MRLAQSLFFLVAAALALAVGAAYADDKIGKDDNDPGFHALDKNKDGYISRAEAKGNPTLSKNFKEADKNGDGKLSRTEYLTAMTKQDAKTAKNKVENAMDRNKDKHNAGTGSTSSKKSSAHLLLIRGRRPLRAPSPICMEGAMREQAQARARDARLARMKWLATGLLLLAGGIYVTAQALQPRYPWLYYVSVTAEAAMVGAIADWFAVTALFHHPFGLRFIPHTAIIPRNKARIAIGLSHFIETNFLTSAAVVQRIRDFQPARTLYRWLLRAENAETVASYVARLAAYGLQAFDDERVRQFPHPDDRAPVAQRRCRGRRRGAARCADREPAPPRAARCRAARAR